VGVGTGYGGLSGVCNVWDVLSGCMHWV
jgi:hypothetical protein